MLPITSLRRNSDAVAPGCMAVDILHGVAEVDVLTAGAAEPNIVILGLGELAPALGTLERELDPAVGDGGHSGVKAEVC
jgi:hypothetical protein